MKKTIYIMLAFLSISMFNELHAQEKSIAVGAGLGGTRGVNEGVRSDRTIGPLFGIYGLFENGLAKGFTPEVAFSYYSNGTSNTGGFSEYTTNYITAELRLRYILPFNTGKWQPYIFAGIGAMMFDVTDTPPNQEPDATTSGTTLSIPLGAGVMYNFNDKWAIDFNFYGNMSASDDLNPVWDDIKDANWAARLGVHYTVFKFETDTDGDGLSDKREIEMGTDPKNPDTDGDGLMDGEEADEYKTDPKNPDTDGGGVRDGLEVRNGADPLDPDDDILSIAPGEKLILRNIEFNTGKSTITQKSERILGFALKALKAAEQMEVEIVGHTDNTGAIELNMQLSKDRADAVKAWLVARGIADNRMTTRGAGPDEPMVPNDTEANRQKNRRVEFMRTK